MKEVKKFEILEHRADLKIRVFGKTREELFRNALIAMSDSLRPKIPNPKSQISKIRIKSANLETLLVDFLNEVLYLTQVNKEVYNNISFKKISDTEIEANLSGQRVESFDEDIKAVTYHNLDVHQEKSGTWQATILFDI